MYTCHFSVLRRCPGRGGRRLRRRVRGLPGLGPGAEGDRAGAGRRPRAEGPLPLAHARPAPPPATARRRSPTPSKPASAPCRPTATGSGCRPRSSATPRTPASCTCGPGCASSPWSASSSPPAAQIRDVRFEPVVLVVNCVRSIVERSTYENYEIVCVVERSGRHRRSSTSCARSPASDCGSSPSRASSTSRPRSTSALCTARESTCCCSTTTSRSRPRTGSSAWSCTPGWTAIGAVGGRLLWGDGRLQHVGVGFDSGLPGHTYRGFAGDFRGYANAVLIARNCLAVTAPA